MFPKSVVIALAISAALLSTDRLNAATPVVPSSTWASASSLQTARSGASATVLADGRVLFAGGFGQSGDPLNSTEIFNTDGSVSAGPPMTVARANHAAVLLQGGDVLVTGGVTSSNGEATSSAELFDPVQNAWIPVSSMAQARAGHTLSLLPDGSVLVVGGTNSSGPVGLLERFDTTAQSFSSAGSLATPRSQHATAVLSDGRVLITGGKDANSNVLASTEIYDLSTGTVSPGPSLITARAGHTATTTLTGAVVVIGGTNPAFAVNGAPAELNTAEIFDPSAATPAFVQSASHLNAARTGHLTFLLPHNANILVVGGTEAGAELSSAEIYAPWLDQFQAAGSMAAARANAAGAPLMSSTGKGVDGLLVVGSGQNTADGTLSSTELYGFATVKTDRADYSPGDMVTITGSGWQPGEMVTLSFRELPNIDTPGPYTAVADQNGNILDTEFAPDLNDAGIRFYLTAAGASSNLQAQITFTDSVTTTTTLSCTPTTVQLQQPTNCSATTTSSNGASFEGTIAFAVNPATGGSFSPASCATGNSPTNSFTCTTTYTPSSIGSQTLTASFTSSNPGKVNSSVSGSLQITVTADLSLDAPSPASVPSGSTGPVTFTAHLLSGTKAISGASVSFTVDGATVGSGTTDASGTAILSTYNPSALAFGSHTVLASFAGGTFGGVQYNSATSNQQTLGVTDISTTTSIDAPAITYGANGTVTVTVSATSGTPTGNVSLSFNGGTPVIKALSGGSATFTSTDIAALVTPDAANYPLSASYAEQNGFAASTGTGTLVVHPLAVTLTAGGYSGAYDGSTHALSACSSSAPTFVTCVNSPAGPVGPEAGSGTVTATPTYVQGSAGDYTLTSNPGSWSIKALPITLNAGGYTGTYDGSTHALIACNSSAPTFVTCANNPAGPVGPDVGSGTVTAAPTYVQGSAGDYTLTSKTGTWSITPLTVTVTAGSYNGTYDGSTHALLACSSSYAGVSCTNNPTGPVGPDVGSATVVPVSKVVAGIAGDYTITPVNGSWSITPLAVTLTAGSYTGVYDGAAHAPLACGSSSPSFVTCTNNPASAGPDVSSGTVTATPVYAQGSAGDYAITSKTGTWSITPLTVTVTAGSYNGTYDGSTHALLACSSSYAGVTCANNPTGPVGPDVASGTVVPVSKVVTGIAGDYTITPVNGSWSITPLAVTLTAGTYTGVYDGMAHAPSACGSSSPSFVTCTNNPASVGPDVSSGTVTAAPTYAQGSAGDFTITSKTGTWSITPLTVTVTAGSYNGTYDGSTHALLACSSSYAGVTCTNSPAGPVGPDVGSGSVDPTSKIASGIAGDYTITPVKGSWSITPLAVTLTAGSYTGVYDGMAHAPSACGSTAPTLLTCANNPASVGPDVSSGTVAPTPVYAQGSAGDFTITSKTGTWSITPLTVTVTAGSYNGTYDGSTHALLACSSSYAGVSCTNNPTGPVGPNVGSGTVVPVPTVIAGITADYSIKLVNSSWSITQLAVTLTAGSYTAVYDGMAHAPSACGSTAPTLLTCTNSPGSVGPSVSSGMITPVLGTYTGILTDYIITKTNGAWTITQAPATATVTVTTDKGLNSSGAPYVQYSDTVSLAISVSPVLVTSPLNPSMNCPDGGACVSVQIGSQIFGPISLTSNGTVLTGSLNTQQVFLAPGSYTVNLLIGNGTNGLSSVNSNYTLGSVILPSGSSTPNANFSVTQEDAQITYTGPMYLNSTSSSMSVTATYTLQDATATGTGSAIYDASAGDITKANVVLTLTNSSNNNTVGTCTPTIVAMPGQVGSNGLPSTATVSCTFSNVSVPGTYALSAAPGSGSYYVFSAGDTGAITITTATGGNGFVTGGGYQTAAYLATPGPSGSNKYSAAGLLKPASGTKVNFGFEAKYQSGNKNLQGGMNLIIRSQCVSANTVPGYKPSPLPGGICVYQVKVPQGQLSSLTETKPPNSKYPYAEMVGSANIFDVTWSNNIQQIANSKTATLLLQMYDVGDPGPGANVDPISIQLTDSTYGLWFSNNWSGTNTVLSLAGTTNPATAPLIEGGNLQVH